MPSGRRDLLVSIFPARGGLSPARVGVRVHARWRGTGPRPTVRGWRFFIVARGPVPRELHWPVMFLGPLGPEENKRRFFHSGNDGEGQALALR